MDNLVMGLLAIAAFNLVGLGIALVEELRGKGLDLKGYDYE